MIVSFSVSNYRSIADEQTLNMVASKRFADSHDQHTEPIPGSDERVLRLAVIYGANGAGKSNFFRALVEMRKLLLEPRGKEVAVDRETFRFDQEAAGQPTSFDLQFIVAEKLYRCGLIIDDDGVVEEWLLQVEGGREKALYERRNDEKGKLAVQIGDSLKKNEKLNALGKIGGPRNQAFLATVLATLDEADYEGELAAIIKWLYADIGMIAPDAPFSSLTEMLIDEEEFREFASEFLRLSSTGVHHLEAARQEITERDARLLVPEGMVTEALSRLQPNGRVKIYNSARSGFAVIVERKSDKDQFYILRARSSHERDGGDANSLELREESDGTQRLLHLLPALYGTRKEEGTYFIDEIDRSMHPLLVWKYIEFFLKECSRPRNQIIVTTHESNLLDLELLRRDEIWFTQKDPSGATKLYSLADFKVRKDLEIRKHYLQGRFGAIPFLSGLDRLIDSKEEQAGT